MRPPTLILATLLAVCLPGASAAAVTIAANHDASITRDQSAGTWTIGSAGAALTLGLDASRDFTVVGLTSPSGQSWAGHGAADTSLRVNNQTVTFGSRAAGFSFVEATVEAQNARLQLNAVFDLKLPALRVTRHYAVVPGSPSFETWTTYTPAGDTPTVGDLNAIQLTIPAGTIHYLTGLQEDSANVADDRIRAPRQLRVVLALLVEKSAVDPVGVGRDEIDRQLLKAE